MSNDRFDSLYMGHPAKYWAELKAENESQAEALKRVSALVERQTQTIIKQSEKIDALGDEVATLEQRAAFCDEF